MAVKGKGRGWEMGVLDMGMISLGRLKEYVKGRDISDKGRNGIFD